MLDRCGSAGGKAADVLAPSRLWEPTRIVSPSAEDLSSREFFV
jgi:hypothetical protein